MTPPGGHDPAEQATHQSTPHKTQQDEPPRRGLGGRFWRLWTATTVSSFGDGLQLSALPLLAASLSQEPLLVAGVTAAATLPWLLFSLPAGAIVDQYDRRRLMWRVNAVRTGLIGVVAVLVAAGLMTLPVLYVLVFAAGIGQTLFDNAAQAILPDLVDGEQLAPANSRWQAGETAGLTFLGPPLGAVLFVAAAAIPFAIDAATFAIAAVLVASIPGTYAVAASTPGPGRARRSLRADIGEGLRWLIGHRLLRPLAIVLCLANLGVFMAEGILVLFATRELGLSRQGFGLLLTGIAVGGLLGAVVAARVAAALGQARTIVLTIAVLTVCHLVVGMLAQAIAVVAVTALVGFATAIWNVVTISLRQAVIPRRLLGRVNSAYRLIGMGSMPVGAVLGGLLGTLLGLRSPFFGAAALMAVALVIAAIRITDPAIADARLMAQLAEAEGSL